MGKYISRVLEEDVAQEIADQCKNIKKMLEPYFVALTQRNGKDRKMAEGREGFVRLISKIALEHDDCLAKKDSAQELVQMLAYDARMESLRQALFAIEEMIVKTQKANAIDSMQVCDRFARSLQANRQNNTALDRAMREVDDWNKRFGRSRRKENEDPGSSTPGTEVATA